MLCDICKEHAENLGIQPTKILIVHTHILEDGTTLILCGDHDKSETVKEDIEYYARTDLQRNEVFDR